MLLAIYNENEGTNTKYYDGKKELTGNHQKIIEDRCWSGVFVEIQEVFWKR